MARFTFQSVAPTSVVQSGTLPAEASSPRRRSMGSPFRLLGLLSLALALGLVLPTVGGTAQEEEEPEIPKPEAVTLETKDHLRLQAMWYQGLGGKEAIPFIMLHDWDGAKEDYDHLALEMQKLGHCVIVPDLRGHGGSKMFAGATEELDRERMNGAAFLATSLDVEACKKFLLEKNNEGLLNIDMLTVVAAGKTCIVATKWAIADWAYPTLGGQRQGQDVKALVFLSPERRFKGTNMLREMRHPLISGQNITPLSLLIAYGLQDRDSKKEAETIHEMLERTRGKLDLEGKSDQERNRLVTEKQDLFLWGFDVEPQGAALVQPNANLRLPLNIGKFVHFRLTAKESNFPWMVRER